jgi:hypothetical protein
MLFYIALLYQTNILRLLIIPSSRGFIYFVIAAVALFKSSSWRNVIRSPRHIRVDLPPESFLVQFLLYRAPSSVGKRSIRYARLSWKMQFCLFPKKGFLGIPK